MGRQLDAFLTFHDYDVSTDAGSVSRKVADALTHEAYETFRISQDQRFESDFERAVFEASQKGFVSD